jgi:hypothetical protein
MSNRFDILAPTKNSLHSEEDNKQTQDKIPEQTTEKKENIFKSKTKNTRFNFSLENSDKSQSYDRDDRGYRDDRGDRGGRDDRGYRDDRHSFGRSSGYENRDNRNSFERRPQRQFRESFFDRKKYAKQYQSKTKPEPPKNFLLDDGDFPTL